MSGADSRLPKEFEFNTLGGASRRRVTHLVEDPTLPSSAPRILETWERTRVLGEGGQGTVLLQRCTSRGPRESTERALKVIRCSGSHGDRARYISELRTIARFSHERYSNIFVKMLGWYFSKGRGDLCIAMDYLPHGDLQTFVDKRGPLPEVEAQQIISQVLYGLSVMHEAGFAHRDVKPQNILIQQYPSSGSALPWWIKLADFGISKSVDATVTAVGIGSHWYMAPELFCPPAEYHRVELRLSDIWSVGATAFFLLTKEVFREKRDAPDGFLGSRGVRDSPSALHFILSTTIPDPTHRLGWEEASSHSWIASPRPALTTLRSEEEDEDDDDSSTTSGSSGSTVDELRGLTTLESRLAETSATAMPADTVAKPVNARSSMNARQIGAKLRLLSDTLRSVKVEAEAEASEAAVAAPRAARRRTDADKIAGVVDGDMGRRMFEEESDHEEQGTDMSVMGLQELRSLVSIHLDLANPDARTNQRGQTPLHVAAQEGSFEAVQTLVRRGAAIDRKDNEGASPLWAAATFGRTRVAEYLKAQGAECPPRAPRRPTRAGQTIESETASVYIFLGRLS